MTRLAVWNESDGTLPIFDDINGAVHSNGSVSIFKTATSGVTCAKLSTTYLQPPWTIILPFEALKLLIHIWLVSYHRSFFKKKKQVINYLILPYVLDGYQSDL